MSRISPGLLLITFFAILIGLAGALIVKQQLARPKLAPQQVVSIPVAARDLPAGRRVVASDTIMKSFTSAERAKLPSVVFDDSKQIVGRVLEQPRPKGEPFAHDMFYPEGREPTVIDRVKPGLRAVSVALERADAVGSQIVPGSFVDIVFRAIPKKDDAIPEETVVLLERIELLAIGENSTPGERGGGSDKGPTIVTLAVTPEQAQELAVVAGHGVISLALRGESEPTTDAVLSPLTLAEVLGIPPRPTPPAPFVAEVYRSGKRQTLEFAGTTVAKEEFGGVETVRPKPPPSPPSTYYQP